MHSNSKLLIAAAAIAAAVVVSPALASAPVARNAPATAGAPAVKYVKTDVDGYFYHLPEGAKNNLEGVRALIVASNGMGMTRVATWQNSITENDGSRPCIGCTTDAFEYNGKGLYDSKQAKLVRIFFDLRLPATRIDVTGADNARSVVVAKDKLTWDETAPGVFKAASTVPSVDRMLPVYLLPSVAIVYAVPVIDKIKVGKSEDGLMTLTFPVAPLGSDYKATVDGNGRVVRTEFRYGGKVYAGEYGEYTNDKMDYHVMAPHHVVQKVDGKVVTDLTLDYHWVNPYLVFPTPKELAAK